MQRTSADDIKQEMDELLASEESLEQRLRASQALFAEFKKLRMVNMEKPMDKIEIRKYHEHFPRGNRFQKFVINEVERLLEKGVLRQSTSSSISDITVEDQNGGLSMIVNFPRIHANHVYNHRIPHLYNFLPNLYTATTFTVLHLCEPYYNVPLEEDERSSTAIITPIGQFEFTKYAPGMINADAALTLELEKCLDGLIGSICFAGLNYVLIYSSTNAQHALDVNVVMDRLHASKFTWDEQKSQFNKDTVNILGLTLQRHRCKKDRSYCKEIVNYPTPSNNEQFMKFYDMAKEYIATVLPWTSANAYSIPPRKPRKFKWTPQLDFAVRMVKKMIDRNWSIHYPNIKKPFHVVSNVCPTKATLYVFQKFDGKFVLVGTALQQWTKYEMTLPLGKYDIQNFIWGLRRMEFLKGNSFMYYTDVDAFNANMTDALRGRIDIMLASLNSSYILCDKETFGVVLDCQV